MHLDRLSALDASFLHREDEAAHMHLGAVLLFEGPPPPIDALLAHVRSRLALVPRYRQKLAVPPGPLGGREHWIDDPDFNLGYHVRHSALPAPGDDEQLRRLIGRVFGQGLDRTKPLWELFVVEGLTGGRFALISKTHHALIDGETGVDLLTIMFDTTPVPPAGPADTWTPNPSPSEAQLATIATGETARDLLRLPGQAAGLARSPERLVGLAGGVAARVGARVRPTPPSPLHAAIGPHRRVAFVHAPLAQLKAVKDAAGGTVNDVVLAAVAGGIRGWLHARGIRADGLELRACVPVSTHAAPRDGLLGNRLAQTVAPLPVGVPDPLERLRLVADAMAGVKDAHGAVGAQEIAATEDLAPPTILARASRLDFGSDLYDLLVTNIPGPQQPLYLVGQRLLELYPTSFLSHGRSLAIAAMSYDGEVAFGLIGDLDALPDIDVVADALRASLDELVAVAVPRRRRGQRARTDPR